MERFVTMHTNKKHLLRLILVECSKERTHMRVAFSIINDFNDLKDDSFCLLTA